MKRPAILSMLVIGLVAAGCGHVPTTSTGLTGKHVLSKAEQRLRARSIISNGKALFAKHLILVQATGLAAGSMPVKGASVKESFQGYEVHQLPDAVTVSQALDTYYADPRVQSAAPLMLYQTSDDPATGSAAPSLDTATNDPDIFKQWWLEKIHAPEAWSLTTGDIEVVTAVLDTGVDYHHPDLEGQIINAPDFGDNDEDSLDEGGHGTHVAGIIAAKNGNGTGGSGLAPGTRVMAVKVFKPFYQDNQYVGFYADDLDIARGIYYAATHGAKIINMSLGGGGGISPLIQEVCDDAAGRGVLVFAAAGNDHVNELSEQSPAGVASVIPVVATDASDRLTGFSNFGRMDALAAPGKAVFSTTPTYQPKYGERMPTSYAFLDGTSMACPIVAGEAALVTSLMLDEVRGFFSDHGMDLTVTPADLPAEEIANAMRYSTGSYVRNATLGYGRIDALAALQKLQDADVIRRIANQVYRKLKRGT